MKNAYNGVIPVQLVKLIQLCYDDWIYWKFKDKKLKQFINAKVNQTIICSKLFNIKGVQFEVFSHPNGYIHNKRDWSGLVVIVRKVKYVPTNIESVTYYIEIKCEALNCSVKRLNEG